MGHGNEPSPPLRDLCRVTSRHEGTRRLHKRRKHESIRRKAEESTKKTKENTEKIGEKCMRSMLLG
jgi:hypothetical protein